MASSPRSIAKIALVSVPLGIALAGGGSAQDLTSFAVIAGETVTNTGPTTITGNIAVSPGTAFTGSGSVTQTGAQFLGDAVAGRIQNDLATLYPILAGRPTSIGGDLTGQDLGGMTLLPGVYHFDSSAGISEGLTLTLDAGGNPDALFIFNIGTTLIAENMSRVVLQNEAQGGNVFYRVGSSATLHTSSELSGQIVALASVTMNTAARIDCGSAFARTGAVTLDTNVIHVCTLAAAGFDVVADAPGLTAQERAVSRTLSDYVAQGGVLPIGFAILAATQTPQELAASLAQMSGEVGTGIAPMGLQSMDAFLDVVMANGRVPRLPAMAPRDAGILPGMVAEKIHTPYDGKYGTSGPALAYPAAVVEARRDWAVWAAAYGSRAVTDGDAAQGWQERTVQNRGLAVGLTHALGEASTVGLALSWNRADFVLGNGAGSGSGDTVYVALHGRSETARGYLEGALAYGRGDIHTARTVTIGGVDRLVRDARADTVAAHVEAGYHMGIVTPFAGLRAQSHRTRASAETAASGVPTYALAYDPVRARSLRSELGVDLRWPAGRTGGPSFGLRAAWAHEFATNGPQRRSFVSVPGTSFPASGATRDRDSLVLAANMGLAAANGVYVDAGVRAEYGRNLRDYGGSITVGYRW
ncbi:MAG: ice-binding family protein [Gemmobacter sp.]